MKDFPEASARSCDLYAKLKAGGFTDYLMVPLPFSDGTINTFSIATRLGGGFLEHALTEFRRLEDMLTVILERFAALETVGTTLSTYLGRDAGRQVMRGRIRAGHGELVEAAILLADLHDFTTHTTRLGPTETVRLLNDYFDCLVGPIEQRGGYVLKFIGDAVLAFFPMSLPSLPPPQPLQAVAGARRRLVELNRARQARGEAALAHSVCLHFGEVLYGNVGSSERLDFTIVGGAVNVTARCLERAQALGADYLATGEFVARFPNTAVRPLGTYKLRGIAKPVSLMALASTEEGEPTSEGPEAR